MNILKGILHRFNKKTNEYDTIHPETEVSQITDFNQGIVNTLASTVLGNLVTELSSDSLISKIVAKVLEVSGVRYSFGETGYIVLGKFFGNFCIQWGVISIDSLKTYKVTYPLKLSNLVYAAVFNWDWNNLTNEDEVHSFTIRLGDDRHNSFYIAPSFVTVDTRWILFGTVD